MTQEARNVHIRKLAVMAKCSAITPDGDMTISGNKIKYVSIQSLSNRLREFCAAEGLDILSSVSDGQVVIELVNVDDPKDRIVSNWPVVPQDKGWAYSIKYPLMRLFLVGDGDEGDEQEMANRSAQAATQAAQRSNGHKAEPKPEPSPEPTAEEMEQLYAITDQLGQTRESVAKVVEIRGYGPVFARAQQALEKRAAEAAEAETLPLEPAPS